MMEVVDHLLSRVVQHVRFLAIEPRRQPLACLAIGICEGIGHGRGILTCNPPAGNILGRSGHGSARGGESVLGPKGGTGRPVFLRQLQQMQPALRPVVELQGGGHQGLGPALPGERVGGGAQAVVGLVVGGLADRHRGQKATGSAAA